MLELYFGQSNEQKKQATLHAQGAPAEILNFGRLGFKGLGYP